MILIYVVLVVLQQLAASSGRSISPDDSEETSKGKIAHLLLPLLGSGVHKDDIKVQVVPYHDYKSNEKNRETKRTVRTAKPVFVQRGHNDVPVAVILAQSKYMKKSRRAPESNKAKKKTPQFYERVENENEVERNIINSDEDHVVIRVTRNKKGVAKEKHDKEKPSHNIEILENSSEGSFDSISIEVEHEDEDDIKDHKQHKILEQDHGHDGSKNHDRYFEEFGSSNEVVDEMHTHHKDASDQEASNSSEETEHEKVKHEHTKTSSSIDSESSEEISISIKNHELIHKALKYENNSHETVETPNISDDVTAIPTSTRRSYHPQHNHDSTHLDKSKTESKSASIEEIYHQEHEKLNEKSAESSKESLKGHGASIGISNESEDISKEHKHHHQHHGNEHHKVYKETSEFSDELHESSLHLDNIHEPKISELSEENSSSNHQRLEDDYHTHVSNDEIIGQEDVGYNKTDENLDSDNKYEEKHDHNHAHDSNDDEVEDVELVKTDENLELVNKYYAKHNHIPQHQHHGPEHEHHAQDSNDETIENEDVGHNKTDEDIEAINEKHHNPHHKHHSDDFEDVTTENKGTEHIKTDEDPDPLHENQEKRHHSSKQLHHQSHSHDYNNPNDVTAENEDADHSKTDEDSDSLNEYKIRHHYTPKHPYHELNNEHHLKDFSDVTTENEDASHNKTDEDSDPLNEKKEEHYYESKHSHHKSKHEHHTHDSNSETIENENEIHDRIHEILENRSRKKHHKEHDHINFLDEIDVSESVNSYSYDSNSQSNTLEESIEINITEEHEKEVTSEVSAEIINVTDEKHVNNNKADGHSGDNIRSGQNDFQETVVFIKNGEVQKHKPNKTVKKDSVDKNAEHETKSSNENNPDVEEHLIIANLDFHKHSNENAGSSEKKDKIFKKIAMVPKKKHAQEGVPGFKYIEKQILDTLAYYVKKKASLEAGRKDHHKAKSYNLSFLFSK